MDRRRFIILDRDGTLIEERHYLSDPKEVCLISGSGEALRQLQSVGFGLVVATNQSAVGRGFFDMDRLHAIHNRLLELLQNEGVCLDGIYVCTHTPEDSCKCRKPELGLMRRAVAELGFDPKLSFMIGDNAVDIEFGRRACATTILVRTGYGREVEKAGEAAPDYVADNLLGAVNVIQSIIATEI